MIRITRVDDVIGRMKLLSSELFPDYETAFASLGARGISLTTDDQAAICEHTADPENETTFRHSEFVIGDGAGYTSNVIYAISSEIADDHL